jgi:hypothetical protein
VCGGAAVGAVRRLARRENSRDDGDLDDGPPPHATHAVMLCGAREG